MNAQLLEKNLWHINQVFGNSENTLDEYTLTKIENPQGKNFVYGNSISYQKGKFYSYYSAPCGNDCFPSSEGTYKIMSDNLIEITLLAFNQSGECPSIHKKYNITALFEIVKKSNKEIILKKIKP